MKLLKLKIEPDKISISLLHNEIKNKETIYRQWLLEKTQELPVKNRYFHSFEIIYF
jgi:hypothetical protein